MMRRIVLAVACVLVGAPASAIGLFMPIALTDRGLGSDAMGSLVQADGSVLVFGSMNIADGRRMPVVWTARPGTRDVSIEFLPLPLGGGGEAVGAASLAGEIIVAGTQTLGNVSTSVTWRKLPGESWSSQTLPAWDGIVGNTRSVGVCAMEDELDSILYLTAAREAGGRSSAIVHEITSLGTFSQVLPGVRDSWPAGLFCGSGPGARAAIAGATDSGPGPTRPVVWVESSPGSHSWRRHRLQVPQGAQGVAYQPLDPAIPLSAVGTIMNGRRARGALWIGHDAPLMLPPLDGFENAGALGALAGFGDILGVRSRVIVGESYHVIRPDGEGASVATVWIDGHPHAAQQLLIDPAAVAEVRKFQSADAGHSAIGQIVATAGGQVQACLFASTATQVPDRIDVVRGVLVGEDGNGAPWLWHGNDANDLRVRLERAGPASHMWVADVILTFRTGWSTFPQEVIITAGTSVRADWAGAGAEGYIDFLQLDETTRQYVGVGQANLTETDQAVSITLPPPGSEWVDPATGEMHLRLRIRATAPMALVSRFAQMNMQF